MATTGKGEGFWAEHVAALRASGQTSVAYANDHGLSVHALGWWRRKLNASEPAGAATTATAPKASKFVALKVSSPMLRSPSGVTITIAGDVRMQMTELPPAAWLAAVSQALRAGMR